MTRRVVTGHTAGKAVVLHDAPAPNVKVRPGSGLVSTLLWVTDESPADLAGGADRAARELGIPPPRNGSIFRLVDFPPGAKGEMHRGSEVHLSAGDVLVQQGTSHAWVNRGSGGCRIAFVLIDAKSPEA